ncbi:MAG: ribosomal protein S18-alanine N-acetyltransferase [Oligoflexia bacterium]
MMPFSFRPATIEDLPELARIEATMPTGAQWTEGQFRSELEKPYSRVLLLTDDETDQLIAGYVVFWLMFDEAQILNIAVDFPYRGLGYGKKMIRQVVAEALKKEIRRVILDVRKGNDPAISLYQSMRFAISHVRRGFYSDGEDAYTMVLDLDLGLDLAAKPEF